MTSRPTTPFCAPQSKHNIKQRNMLLFKQCSRCRDTLPATREFFYADRRLSDGLYVHCKSCQVSAANKDITKICYKQMLQRCVNPRSTSYRYYGGKGIRVSDEWLSFEQFLKDMGQRPSIKHSIGRHGDVGNYCKENCRWMTRTEQGLEKRAKNRAKRLEKAA